MSESAAVAAQALAWFDVISTAVERGDSTEQMLTHVQRAERDIRELATTAEQRLQAAEARESALRKALVPAQRLADYFVSKTTNLVTMRCDMCWMEWVRGGEQEHDATCPVGDFIKARALLRAAEGGERDT